MAELKTKETGASAWQYLAGKADGHRLAGCQTLIGIMREVTGEEPKLWGTGLVGFGKYHYKYASGREGDWPLCGFALRKTGFTIYIMAGLDESGALLSRLGKYKNGKSCLYAGTLDGLDLGVLKQLLAASVEAVKQRYG